MFNENTGNLSVKIISVAFYSRNMEINNERTINFTNSMPYNTAEYTQKH
jgi:hypothetical protein